MLESLFTTLLEQGWLLTAMLLGASVYLGRLLLKKWDEQTISSEAAFQALLESARQERVEMRDAFLKQQEFYREFIIKGQREHDDKSKEAHQAFILELQKVSQTQFEQLRILDHIDERNGGKH